jgi:pantoate--beta-alanine ligase
VRILHTISELREALAGASRTAFVPTMGNLHEGHLSLVRTAAQLGGPVVASIFVNRLQFAPHEDFDTYPRTLERDADMLRGAGCHFVFAPTEAELYPEPQVYKVHPPAELADVLEGHFRPGFYTGVCTVVLKLFNCVQPRVAVFGKKDYQQLLMIRRMVRQLALPIDIVGGETQRAPSGLALSSRNGYLSEQQRTQAAELSAMLQGVRAQVQQGAVNYSALEQQAMTHLQDQGWTPDYVALRQRDELAPLSNGVAYPAQSLVALTAARIGTTRLIDNLEL